MKKLIAIMAAFLLVGSMCFAADLAEGFWISVDEKTNDDTSGRKAESSAEKFFQ